MYDLIGDIHGQADELEQLLFEMGYREKGSVFRHEDGTRRVIFLGDFIDRGPHQKRVVEIAKRMIEEGQAKAVMGNHEYNAIAYYTSRVGGGYLRERTEKNTNQHQAFLDEFRDDPSGWADTIDWFKSLPLWLDEEGFRVVHACWDLSSIDEVLEFQKGSNFLSDELLHASSDKVLR